MTLPRTPGAFRDVRHGRYRMGVTDTFPIRYSPRFTWLFLPLLLGPRHAEVRTLSPGLRDPAGFLAALALPEA